LALPSPSRRRRAPIGALPPLGRRDAAARRGATSRAPAPARSARRGEPATSRSRLKSIEGGRAWGAEASAQGCNERNESLMGSTRGELLRLAPPSASSAALVRAA